MEDIPLWIKILGGGGAFATIITAFMKLGQWIYDKGQEQNQGQWNRITDLKEEIAEQNEELKKRLKTKKEELEVLRERNDLLEEHNAELKTQLKDNRNTKQLLMNRLNAVQKELELTRESFEDWKAFYQELFDTLPKNVQVQVLEEMPGSSHRAAEPDQILNKTD